MYSIGQLSKKSGVTIRTLDYYDEIELLKPSSKTEGGHRLYTENDVLQLQRILSLKYMGFSLEKIKEVLIDSKQTWQHSLEEQLQMVRQEQNRLKILERALLGVSWSFEIEGKIDWEMIFDIIQLFQNPEIAFEPYESYLNKEQIHDLMKMNDQLSDQDIQVWIQVIQEIKNNLDLEPSSEQARRLVSRWLELAQNMFGNDEELLGDLQDSLLNLQDGIVFYPLNKQVVHFIAAVLTSQSE